MKMKKYIIAAGVALLGLTSVNAQEMNFGAKAGVNLANLSGDDVSNNEMLIGAFGGVYANMELSDKIFFQPELLFSMQGAKFKAEGIEGELKYNFINVPLMLQYGVTDNIRVELGPQVGLVLSADSKTGDVDVDVKDNTKTIDFGVNLGGTYYMDNGLNFTVRYNMGLTKLGKASSTTVGGITVETEESDIKNSVISIGVGYSL